MTVSPFMFATGIENSYPTINNGQTRIDEMDKCGHYEKWCTDFDLVDDLGVSFLRYGPPIHKTWIGEGQYYWEFTDLTFADLKRRDIVPIVDLCHFGVPDWVGNFQNPDFPPCSPATLGILLSGSRGFSSTPQLTRCLCAQHSRLLSAGGTSSYGATRLL